MNKAKKYIYFLAASTVPAPNEWMKQVNSGFGPSTSLLNFGLIYFQGKIVPFVVSLLLFLVIVLALGYLIYGGILWITSGGDKEGMTKAKNTVSHALVGLALGLASFIIVNILFSFFGVGFSTPLGL